MKKKHLIITALSLAALLSGCKEKPVNITDSELSGVWYASNSGVYQTISFEDDNVYSTENFVADGEYQLAKDGTVKLVDHFRNVETLVPVLSDGEWTLKYEQPYIPILFTREVMEKENFSDVEANETLEGKTHLMSAVAQILAGVDWETEDGVHISMTSSAYQMGDEEPVKYTYADAQTSKDGGYIFYFSNENGSYRGVLKETMATDDLYDYDVSLYLNGDLLFSASDRCPCVPLENE